MGSTTSTEIPHSATPCTVIQLQSWKGAKMERIIAVPVTESLFGCSHEHPLFQLLLQSRNEPAVRHWYDAPKSSASTAAPSPPIDRTKEVEPEVSGPELYEELFPTTTSTTTTSRWMMVSVASTSNKSAKCSNCYVSTAEAQQMCEEGADAQVAGYFEARHGPSGTAVSYFMVKTFTTEAKSLVLFQVVAFMESTRRKDCTPTPNEATDALPASLELSPRHGDIPSLRMLDSAFRRLLPLDRCSELHQQVTLCESEESTPYRRVVVRLSSSALTEVLAELSHVVHSMPGRAMFSLTVDQRPVEPFETPVQRFLDCAKSAWTSENLVVISNQPNVVQRGRASKRRRNKKAASMKRQSSPVTQVGESCSSSSSVGERYDCTEEYVTVPKTSPSVESYNHYRLPLHTPVHHWDEFSSSWVPLYLSDTSPRMTFCDFQSCACVGKVKLETWDQLHLADANGTPFQTVPAKNYIAVSSGCQVEWVSGETGEVIEIVVLTSSCLEM